MRCLGRVGFFPALSRWYTVSRFSIHGRKEWNGGTRVGGASAFAFFFYASYSSLLHWTVILERALSIGMAWQFDFLFIFLFASDRLKSTSFVVLVWGGGLRFLLDTLCLALYIAFLPAPPDYTNTLHCIMVPSLSYSFRFPSFFVLSHGLEVVALSSALVFSLSLLLYHSHRRWTIYGGGRK